MKLGTALIAAALALPAAAQANCPDGVADLQGDYVFQIFGLSATTGVFGYAAAGVMTFDGQGSITFPDAVDSATPPDDEEPRIAATYRVRDPAHCTWRMDLHINNTSYQLSLDGTTHLVGAVRVGDAFLILTAELLHGQ